VGRDTKYAHVVRAISETPWAILPDTLSAIVDLIAFRAEGGTLADAEIQARIGAGPASKASYQSGDVAVIPLYGVIFPRATLISEMSGGTSLQQFGGAFDQAVQDPRVGAILIDVSSPGGSTSLVAETALKIRSARGTKPIVAIANTTMASAAYHLGSQADEIVASPSALLGSIGCFMAHDDLTGLNEKLGVKTTLISAGKYKTEGNPNEPLGPEAQAAFQALVDDAYEMFVNDVAKARGINASAVANGYGEGRIVPASQAVKLGMADRIDTFEATLARLQASQAPAPGQSLRANADPAEIVATEPATEDTGFTDEELQEATADAAAIASDMRTDNETAALADLRALTDITRREIHQ